MDHLALRWETDSRYYAVCLHSDLWGDKVLTKVWGGKGSHIDAASTNTSLPI